MVMDLDSAAEAWLEEHPGWELGDPPSSVGGSTIDLFRAIVARGRRQRSAMTSGAKFEPQELRFSLDVAPVPKGRARVVRQRGRMRGLTPEKTAAFEQALGLACAAARPRGWDADGWYRAEIVVRRARRQGDADNFAKAVLDSANGIAWRDDARVLSLEVAVCDGVKPGIDVRILRFAVEAPRVCDACDGRGCSQCNDGDGD
jgi:Holliday junction resolvase RusA-like endonuclease